MADQDNVISTSNNDSDDDNGSFFSMGRYELPMNDQYELPISEADSSVNMEDINRPNNNLNSRFSEKTYEIPAPIALRNLNNPNFEGYRYRIPILESHTLVLGPTQSGKTSFILKLFIDGFKCDLGQKPFDMVIYVGNEEPSNEFAIAAQVSNFTYLNITPDKHKPIPVKYISKTGVLNELSATLNSEQNKPLKKLVVIDDVIKINDANINKNIASLVSEGQHINAHFILVMHNTSGEKVVEIRNACRTRIFVGPVDARQLGIVCGNSAGSKAYAQYADYINAIPLNDENGKPTYKRILIYDSFTKFFYNYNLEKINV